MLNVHTECEKALIMFDYIWNYWYPVLCYQEVFKYLKITEITADILEWKILFDLN